MNKFYNNEQKNGIIFDEIKLTQEQINILKIKNHVMQYIKDNNNEEENKNNNNYNDFMNLNTNVKNEGFTSDLFNGLNLNFNINSNNDNNKN